jgi:hypothetical protein
VVEVVRFEAGRVLLASGLAQGDRVVAHGGQLLYPGQAVEVANMSEAQQGSATE